MHPVRPVQTRKPHAEYKRSLGALPQTVQEPRRALPMASDLRIWGAVLKQQFLWQEQGAPWCEFLAVQNLLQKVMRACWQYTGPVISHTRFLKHNAGQTYTLT